MHSPSSSMMTRSDRVSVDSPYCYTSNRNQSDVADAVGCDIVVVVVVLALVTTAAPTVPVGYNHRLCWNQ